MPEHTPDRVLGVIVVAAATVRAHLRPQAFDQGERGREAGRVVDQIAGQRDDVVALAGQQLFEPGDLARLDAAAGPEVEIRQVQHDDPVRRQARPVHFQRKTVELDVSALDLATRTARRPSRQCRAHRAPPIHFLHGIFLAPDSCGEGVSADKYSLRRRAEAKRETFAHPPADEHARPGPLEPARRPLSRQVGALSVERADQRQAELSAVGVACQHQVGTPDARVEPGFRVVRQQDQQRCVGDAVQRCDRIGLDPASDHPGPPPRDRRPPLRTWAEALTSGCTPRRVSPAFSAAASLRATCSDHRSLAAALRAKSASRRAIRCARVQGQCLRLPPARSAHESWSCQ